jgi:hypothetical protein
VKNTEQAGSRQQATGILQTVTQLLSVSVSVSVSVLLLIGAIGKEQHKQTNETSHELSSTDLGNSNFCWGRLCKWALEKIFRLVLDGTFL